MQSHTVRRLLQIAQVTAVTASSSALASPVQCLGPEATSRAALADGRKICSWRQTEKKGCDWLNNNRTESGERRSVAVVFVPYEVALYPCVLVIVVQFSDATCIKTL